MLPSLASTRLVDDEVYACDHCGRIAPDVRPELCHIGGEGYAVAHYCENTAACWRRWEASNSYVARV